MSKTKSYADLGFDAFLNKGPGSSGKDVSSLADLSNGFQSAIRQNSITESLSLGQAPMTVSDGRNLRIVIGRR